MSSDLIRILVVDDDRGDYERTRAVIHAIDHPEARHEVGWASSWEEAFEAFDRREHDLYFVDYLLGERDGLDLVRAARRHGVREPLIMLTGRGSHEIDVEAMEAGASDYLVKERIDPDILERTIRYAVERFRTGEALRESEERHRGMFDHLPVGLYRCSTDGGFMDANPALVRMLGRPGPETLREEYARTFYVAGAHRDRFLATLESAGVVRGFESTLERTDGTSLRVRNTARAHRGPDGTIEYVEGTVEDVTEIESAQRIRGRARRFDLVWERSHLAILLLDDDGAVIDANPTFRRAFDYGGDELVGRSFDELAAPADGEAVARGLAALATGETDTLEEERRLVAGDGTVLWARLLGSRVTDTDGRGGSLMILLDEVAEAPGEG